jgi:hypothetical protein
MPPPDTPIPDDPEEADLPDTPVPPDPLAPPVEEPPPTPEDPEAPVRDPRVPGQPKWKYTAPNPN